MKSFYRGLYPGSDIVPVHQVFDFVTHHRYQKVGNGSCTVEPVFSDTMLPPCIPGNATLLRNTTIGYSAQSLHVNVWQFEVLGNNGWKQRMEMGVTENCVPVVDYTFAVIDGNFWENNMYFIDYHPGVDDMSFFDIPDDCP